MGAGHAHALYVHEHSPVHRLAPEVKVAATIAFVTAVAVTPREAFWAFAVHAAVLAGVAHLGRVRARFVLARLAVIAPFLLLALLLPFVGRGDEVTVAGLALSRDGLTGAWNILAKATLGGSASILLAATTEVPRILEGLERLHLPRALTMIAAFMVRYLELTAEELSRMRTAMTARGYAPRWIAQARPIAASAGTLFIRTYERGERVHAAMLARGYTGSMPDLGGTGATRREWCLGAPAPVLAWTVAVAALLGAG